MNIKHDSIRTHAGDISTNDHDIVTSLKTASTSLLRMEVQLVVNRYRLPQNRCQY